MNAEAKPDADSIGWDDINIRNETLEIAIVHILSHWNL